MNHKNKKPLAEHRPWINTAIVLSIAPAAKIVPPVDGSEAAHKELDGGIENAAPVGELDQMRKEGSDEQV